MSECWSLRKSSVFDLSNGNEASLSGISSSGDALGPLFFKKKIGLSQLVLTGEVFYSRFRPGDRVELRIQKPNTDRSLNLSYDWKVNSVSYPAPGKIEILISGEKPIDLEAVREIFLFKSSSARFSNLLIKKMNELPSFNESKI